MERTRTLFFPSLSACLAAAALAGGCHDTEAVNGGPLLPPPPAPTAAVDDAAAWLQGSYSSAAQAADDSAYFDVRLHVVRVWPDRTDGPWLYVEQAMAATPETPYRQRIYHVVDAPGGAAQCIVFELPGDPLSFAGAWAEPARMNAMDPTLLEPRVGCSVTLRRTGAQELSGATEGDGCGSTRDGAAWSSSTVTLTPGMLLTWDRGFDRDGRQVWGAVKGPYRFMKEGTVP
jgi:hypothetical protein